MDKNDFDLMRHKASMCRDKEAGDLFSDVVNTLERIWNKLTSSPVDITKHDDHGRVEMKEDK